MRRDASLSILLLWRRLPVLLLWRRLPVLLLWRRLPVLLLRRRLAKLLLERRLPERNSCVASARIMLRVEWKAASILVLACTQRRRLRHAHLRMRTATRPERRRTCMSWLHRCGVQMRIVPFVAMHSVERIARRASCAGRACAGPECAHR